MFDCSQMLKFLLTFGSLLSVGFPRAKVPRLFTEPLLPSSAPCDGYEGTGAAAPYSHHFRMHGYCIQVDSNIQMYPGETDLRTHRSHDMTADDSE